MIRSDNERLGDIIHAGRRLAEISRMGRDVYDQDWSLQESAAHLIGIIVDAYSKLGHEAQEAFGHMPKKAMGDMRIRIVHIYWASDPGIVWDTLTDDIPGMVETAVREHQPPTTGPTVFDEDVSLPRRHNRP